MYFEDLVPLTDEDYKVQDNISAVPEDCKICKKCGRAVHESKFSVYNKATNARRKVCNSCRNNKQRKHKATRLENSNSARTCIVCLKRLHISAFKSSPDECFKCFGLKTEEAEAARLEAKSYYERNKELLAAKRRLKRNKYKDLRDRWADKYIVSKSGGL